MRFNALKKRLSKLSAVVGSKKKFSRLIYVGRDENQTSESAIAAWEAENGTKVERDWFVVFIVGVKPKHT